MNICVPIEMNEGMDSKVYGHFGSAPYFAIYDTRSREMEVINNGNLHHAHGQCSPIAALSGRQVDILATGGIGAGAIERLRMMGVKVCRVGAGLTVREVISIHGQDGLREVGGNDICSHHSCS
jgi:predicted Fe-Mo cluster-binding NifX family protein